MLTIRKARGADFPCIHAVYAAARQKMRDGGNTIQWQPGDAPEEKLNTDIAAEQLYVVEEGGTIHGAFAFIVGPDPTYDRIEDGAWRWDDTYGTLHRLGGDGTHGVFDAVVAWMRGQMGHLRVDTHESNSVMRHLLESRGFHHCGTIYVPDGTPRLAYEWHA